jgi:hypothetical protein
MVGFVMPGSSSTAHLTRLAPLLFQLFLAERAQKN